MKINLDNQEERALSALLHLSQHDDNIPGDMKYTLSRIIEQLRSKQIPFAGNRQIPYILTREGLRKELDGRLTPEVLSYLFR